MVTLLTSMTDLHPIHKKEYGLGVGKIFICPPLFNCPKSCLPPGSDDGNTIEGMIMDGLGVLLVLLKMIMCMLSRVILFGMLSIIQIKLLVLPVIMPSITVKNVEWDCWSS